ncbi:hypothetical protein ACRAWD_24585 [Caulobacter segnis]
MTLNVSVFDFTTGQTVLISRTDGGNAALRNDNRQVQKLGVNYKPIDKVELTFNATYTRSQTKNMIAASRRSPRTWRPRSPSASRATRRVACCRSTPAR